MIKKDLSDNVVLEISENSDGLTDVAIKLVLINNHGQLEFCSDLSMGYMATTKKDALIGLKKTILEVLPKINNGLNNTLIELEKEIRKL